MFRTSISAPTRKPLLALLLLLAVACGTATTSRSSLNECTPGASGACTCTNGAPGAQTCGGDSTYGECTCGNVGGMADGGGPSAKPDGSVPDGGTTTAGGPIFLSFGTDVTSMSAYDSVTFTTVVSHPDGTDALAGGSLVSQDGTIQYGPFGTGGAQKGAYSLTLSWWQLNKVKSIDFTTEEKRTFVAEFFDTKGRKSTKTVTIRLHCNGKGACSGTCGINLKTDMEHCGTCAHACAATADECFEGTCYQTTHSATRSSCDASCKSVKGKCDSSPPAGLATYYTTYEVFQDITACTEVPAATISSKGATHAFLRMECSCVMP